MPYGPGAPGWRKSDLEVNPAKRIKLVGRQEASKREGLSDTQANALLRQAQTGRSGRRNCAIVQLLLQTGIRLDECSQLTLADIEFGERSGRVTIRQGKGNKACNYLAQYPGDVVRLATLLEHSSLDTTRIYSQPTVEQLAARMEQLRQNAYGE